MASAMEVDRATAADVAALADLRVAQGWARTETLLRALMAWEHGCILVVRERETPGGSPGSTLPVATVSAIATPPVGVIGNVIVREDFRRQGLSRIVMSAALDWLRLHGAPIALLDATPDGRPVYERLGFVPVTRSWASWTPISVLDMAALDRLCGRQTARLATAEALPRVVTLDAAAFGGDRSGLLEVMLREPEHQLILATDADDAVTGYAIARELDGGRQGLRVGPWVAREPEVAAALLRAALAPVVGAPEISLVVSCPETSDVSLQLLAALGAHVEVDDVVMRLDLDVPATPAKMPGEHPDWVYGWLAPMVF